MGVSPASVVPMNPLFRDSSPSPGAGGPPANARRTRDTRGLAAAVREAVRSGRIPARPADQMWGGPGSGGWCAVCNDRIERHDVEYELEFAQGAGAGAGSYRLHVPCCMAWETELS